MKVKEESEEVGLKLNIQKMRIMASANLRLLISLPAILIPACASSSPAFRINYSAYKLNKQGYNIALMYSFSYWLSAKELMCLNCGVGEDS